jgi:hypothetical protein
MLNNEAIWSLPWGRLPEYSQGVQHVSPEFKPIPRLWRGWRKHVVFTFPKPRSLSSGGEDGHGAAWAPSWPPRNAAGGFFRRGFCFADGIVNIAVFFWPTLGLCVSILLQRKDGLLSDQTGD